MSRRKSGFNSLQFVTKGGPADEVKKRKIPTHMQVAHPVVLTEEDYVKFVNPYVVNNLHVDPDVSDQIKLVEK